MLCFFFEGGAAGAMMMMMMMMMMMITAFGETNVSAATPKIALTITEIKKRSKKITVNAF